MCYYIYFIVIMSNVTKNRPTRFITLHEVGDDGRGEAHHQGEEDGVY